MEKILKHKYEIIAGIFVIAILAFVFIWGGNFPTGTAGKSSKTSVLTTSQSTYSPTSTPQAKSEIKITASPTSNPTKLPEAKKGDSKAQNAAGASQKTEEKTEIDIQSTDIHHNESVDEIKMAEQEHSYISDTYNYQTESTTENHPAPAMPEDIEVTNKTLTCTLSVRCDTILQNISWLAKEKVDIVPKDGVIFPEKEVTFYEGESVFNVLLREMKKNKIHFEYVNTPIYHSAYIEGIANLYEFDCGELSGWVYRVNGWFPNYGCSRYILKQGDKIEWLYTCDLGNDVGSKGRLQKDD